MAKFLNDLGTIYQDWDRLRDAENCYTEAISILRRCSCADKTLAIASGNLAEPSTPRAEGTRMPRSYSGRLSGSPLPHLDRPVPRSQLSIQNWLTCC